MYFPAQDQSAWRRFDMDIVSEKVCSKCGLPKTTDCFAKDKSRADGLFPQCKDCGKPYRRKYYLANKEKIISDTTKRRKNDRDKANRQSRAWDARNKEKKKESAKKSYHKNKALHPKVLKDPLVKLEENRLRVRRWNAEHPERRAEHSRNRRASKKGNGGHITAKEWEELKAFYDYTCLRCGRKEPEIKLTLDHVLPLKMGGRHEISNAQPLCNSCNASKQARHIDYR